ncbi:MAG: DUF1178 family protein [Alphaproteobacteria bacterium]|nr:DUF1178 family protein [Alphaproteobacteria bacterium]
MIKYSLICDKDHEFEGWFSNSDAFDTQVKRGFVDCPHCGSIKVSKALMAPAISTARKKQARAEAAIRSKLAAGAAAASAASASPAVPASGSEMTLLDPQQQQLRAALRELHEKIAANTDDVGDKFPEEARKIHYGDAPARSIRGSATIEQAKELWDEGIPVLPVPALPDERN